MAFVNCSPPVRGRCWLFHELGDYFHLHFLKIFFAVVLIPVAVTKARAIVSQLLAGARVRTEREEDRRRRR